MFNTENFLDYVDKASKETEKDIFEKVLTNTQKRLSDKINGNLINEEIKDAIEEKPKKKRGRPRKNPVEKLSEVKVIAEAKEEEPKEEEPKEEEPKEEEEKPKEEEIVIEEPKVPEELEKVVKNFSVIGSEIEEDEPEEMEIELTPIDISINGDEGSKEPEKIEVELQKQDSMLNIPQQPMYVDNSNEILNKINMLEENINKLNETIATLTDVISSMSNKNKKRIVINRDNTGKIIHADLITTDSE